MNQGLAGFHLCMSDGRADCVEGAGCMASAGRGFR